MLSEEALKAAGPSCEALHAYFMEQSVKGAHGIPAKVAESYFESDGELSFTIGFNDLYDLFNMDSLDVSLLRCWTMRMKKQSEEMGYNVGFLDPQIFSTIGDYKPTKKVDQAAPMMLQGMLGEFILKEIIDPKGDFYNGPADAA
ncbi:unnamed protein product [Urochloa decumbens]|uniref:Uncharacterized protein n=1 Tax=Urochloa decumbens TaxID=240449 RepID=A0ABC9FMZ5_9POAL